MRNNELERVTGIEPAYRAWEASVLPLNYTRVRIILLGPMRSWQTIVCQLLHKLRKILGIEFNHFWLESSGCKGFSAHSSSFVCMFNLAL